MSEIITVRLDLAKNVFQAQGDPTFEHHTGPQHV